MPEVKLSGIDKSFGKRIALSGVDLSIKSGKRLAIVGPSGSGKSTLLRIIAGLETDFTGTVEFDGVSATAMRIDQRGIGMVFQGENLVPQMTVRENMGLGLKLKGCATSEIAERVARTAERLRLENLLDRGPQELSGGERQRVALSRLVVTRPPLWLLDEPLSNVDPGRRRSLRQEICSAHEDAGSTVVYVTHDQQEAMAVGHQVAVLAQGQLQQIAPPVELYQRPSNRFVASFIGSPPMNLILGHLAAERLELLGSDLPLEGERYEGDVICGIRAESFHLNNDHAISVCGQVTSVDFLGHEQILGVRLSPPDAAVSVRLTEAGRAAVDGATDPLGQQIQLSVRVSDIHLFRTDGTRLVP